MKMFIDLDYADHDSSSIVETGSDNHDNNSSEHTHPLQVLGVCCLIDS